MKFDLGCVRVIRNLEKKERLIALDRGEQAKKKQILLFNSLFKIECLYILSILQK